MYNPFFTYVSNWYKFILDFDLVQSISRRILVKGGPGVVVPLRLTSQVNGPRQVKFRLRLNTCTYVRLLVYMASFLLGIVLGKRGLRRCPAVGLSRLLLHTKQRAVKIRNLRKRKH